MGVIISCIIRLACTVVCLWSRARAVVEVVARVLFVACMNIARGKLLCVQLRACVEGRCFGAQCVRLCIHHLVILNTHISIEIYGWIVPQKRTINTWKQTIFSGIIAMLSPYYVPYVFVLLCSFRFTLYGYSYSTTNFNNRLMSTETDRSAAIYAYQSN